MRASTTNALAAHQLAGLALLEAAIEFASRALVHTYPGVNKVERPGETGETATAHIRPTDPRIRTLRTQAAINTGAFRKLRAASAHACSTWK